MGVGFNLGNCYEAYNSMEDDDWTNAAQYQ